LAGEIRVFVFDENADFNARTFPKLISYLGIIVSFLTLVLSRGADEPLGKYEWLKVLVLFVLVFTYGVIIKSIGFFISTNLFLLVSYYYLGLRNYKVLLLCSIPVVAALQFMLHGLLDVYIRDPFLQLLGIIS
jgi:putative tricarboxylic transport membrane protein